MNKFDIEKEIINRIVAEDETACQGQEIADIIMGEKSQDIEFTDTKDEDKTDNSTNSDIETEDTKEEIKDDDDDKNNALGKFKNPEELLRAYGELEREFTRRSQRLKELENGKKKMSDEDFKVAVDKFFERTPSAKVFAKDIAQKLMQQPDLKNEENCLDIALNQVLIDKFRTPEQLLADGQFLEEFVLSSQAVKDAVISKYLKDVREGRPPKTLSADGTNGIAPFRSPKTIEEAGVMFLKNNK